MLWCAPLVFPPLYPQSSSLPLQRAPCPGLLLPRPAAHVAPPRSPIPPHPLISTNFLCRLHRRHQRHEVLPQHNTPWPRRRSPRSFPIAPLLQRPVPRAPQNLHQPSLLRPGFRDHVVVPPAAGEIPEPEHPTKREGESIAESGHSGWGSRRRVAGSWQECPAAWKTGDDWEGQRQQPVANPQSRAQLSTRAGAAGGGGR